MKDTRIISVIGTIAAMATAMFYRFQGDTESAIYWSLWAILVIISYLAWIKEQPKL